MSEECLIKIYGGASKYSINGTLLNAISRALSTVMAIGRVIGSAIRRARNGYYC